LAASCCLCHSELRGARGELAVLRIFTSAQSPMAHKSGNPATDISGAVSMLAAVGRQRHLLFQLFNERIGLGADRADDGRAVDRFAASSVTPFASTRAARAPTRTSICRSRREHVAA
jgi:hypothetical protein